MLLLAPYFLLRGLRDGKYLHNFRERLGNLGEDFPQPASQMRGGIWLHAVSVGEVQAAIPLARELKRRFPGRPLLVSTTTDTGQQMARQKMDFADGFFYFPLDWRGPVRRLLQTLRPALAVVVETEIWPNFLRECRRAGVPVVFVNGRISTRSFGRYRLLQNVAPDFVADVLHDAELFLMQTEADAKRLRELGGPAERVEVTGNLKYDVPPPDAGHVATWLAEQIERQERWPVIVAGSVLAGEEEQVLAAFDIVQRKWRRALLVLAPRKPERFEDAGEIAAQGGWSVVRRRSANLGQPLAEDADVFLLDSFGELAGIYRLADAVFIGGSLVDAGGHNILEAAAFGRPPMFGPSMDNFEQMAREFLEEMAAVQVHSGEQLGQAWVELISHPERRERMGRVAREIVERNQGATSRSVERIARVLEARGPAQ